MSRSFLVNPNAPVQQGNSLTVISERVEAAGIASRLVSLNSDGILLSVFVRNLVGSLNVSVYAVNGTGARSHLFSFPQINSATPELLLKSIGPTLSLIEIQCEFTGMCDYEIGARGISLAEVATKVVPAKTFNTGKVILGTLPAVLIPTTNRGRTAVMIKNLSKNGTAYIGGSLDEATVAEGFPVGPGESFSVEITGSQAIYAIGTASDMDIRFMEANE